MAERKGTSNNIQKTAKKTKDWAAQTPLKTGSELRCSGWIRVPAPHMAVVIMKYK